MRRVFVESFKVLMFLKLVIYLPYANKSSLMRALYLQRGSPHGALNPHLMRIGDSDSKTTLPLHGLDPDPSCVLCCVTVSEIQSSSAMRVVCVPCGAHARPHWIRIGDPDSVNPFSVPVWRALLSLPNGAVLERLSLITFYCFLLNKINIS